MKLNVPEELEYLSSLFKENGKKIFVVGGMIRNTLLSLPISDIDTSSAMLPDEVMALCRKNNIKTFEKGIKYGTVEIHIGDFVTEHTTFRSDVYAGGGNHKPTDVKFSDSLTADAHRRDFTVNAIYYDIAENKIIDPTGGTADLENKLIRATSKNPDIILQDDGLRILRLVRFASELGFDVEKETLESAKRNVKGLLDISGERIRDELFKILMSDSRYEIKEQRNRVLFGLMLLKDIGALDIILPELTRGRGMAQKKEYHAHDVLDHMLHTAACSEKDIVMRVAGLLHDVGKPEIFRKYGKYYGHDKEGEKIARKILSRLRCSTEFTDKVCMLVRNHMYDLQGTAKEKTIRQKFAALGLENAKMLIQIREADVHGSGIITGEVQTAEKWKKILQKMQDEGVPFDERDLNITGEDIMEHFSLSPSKKIGEIKHSLFLHCAIRPHDNKKEILLKVARDYL
ncbi:MAG: CCA tRNA nucleotidyltransferase [Clostridia bacterium]|nr:CCA tRNA nucleotidyltransferase [Clostridia bacterium]